MISDVFKETKNGLEFSVYLTPGSQREAVTGVFSDELGALYLKVSIHAKPTNNNANDSLVKFLASVFKIAKTKISIKSGLKSRKKLIFAEAVFVLDIPQEIVSIVNNFSNESRNKQMLLF